MKKQLAKSSEYENWVGAMSGKIKSISPEGRVELESVGLQVFEKKTTAPDAKSERSSQAQGVKSSSAPNPDNIQTQPLNQSLDSKQLEPEAKIQKLIATATSPRDKAFYQELLQKARAERTNLVVESSKESDPQKQNIASKKEKAESSTEKKQNEKPIFQAVGIIEGKVESIDNKLKVSIGEYSYDLKFIPGAKKRQWSKLKQEIEEKGNCSKTLIVYPQANLNKKGEIKIAVSAQ